MSRPALVAVSVLLGGGVLAVVGLNVLIEVHLAGGVHNLVYGAPQPGDADVVAAERSVRPLDEESLASITGSIIAPGSAFTTVVATARATECDQGQHSTWSNDSYDLRCVLSDTAVITGGSPQTFVEDMDAVDAGIRAQGWVSDSSDDMLAALGHWASRDEGNQDMLYPAHLPKVGYSPDALSMTRRQSVVLPIDAGVEVAWIQPGDESPWYSVHSIDGKDRWRAADGRPVTQQDVVDMTSEGSYLLTITVHRPYYEQ